MNRSHTHFEAVKLESTSKHVQELQTENKKDNINVCVCSLSLSLSLSFNNILFSLYLVKAVDSFFIGCFSFINNY